MGENTNIMMQGIVLKLNGYWLLLNKVDTGENFQSSIVYKHIHNPLISYGDRGGDKWVKW